MRNTTPQTAATPPIQWQQCREEGNAPRAFLPTHPTEGTQMIIELLLATAISATPATIIEKAAHIPPAQQQFRDCVAQRESGGNYRAKNKNSSAQGRWQWLDSQWRHGLAHMVAASLHQHGMTWEKAKKIRTHLRATPIRHWKPAYQNVAFAATLNAKGPWTGAHHWHHPGSHCNNLIKATP